MIVIEARRLTIEMSITDFCWNSCVVRKIYEKKWPVYAY